MNFEKRSEKRIREDYRAKVEIDLAEDAEPMVHCPHFDEDEFWEGVPEGEFRVCAEMCECGHICDRHYHEKDCDYPSRCEPEGDEECDCKGFRRRKQ